jgi:hypothetical protein
MYFQFSGVLIVINYAAAAAAADVGNCINKF